MKLSTSLYPRTLFKAIQILCFCCFFSGSLSAKVIICNSEISSSQALLDSVDDNNTGSLLDDINECILAITPDLYIEQSSPVPVCNDLIIVSLAGPNEIDENQTGSFFDDLNECILEITPSMVLQNPGSNLDDYTLTIYDETGAGLIVYSANGLPLDANGQEVTLEDGNIAHHLVSPAQLTQTLNFSVSDTSGNRCWGKITVEDKVPPSLICNDYELNCNDPNALDPFYSAYPAPYDVYDCSLEEVKLLSEQLMETNCDLSEGYSAKIVRVWQAIDSYGNSTTCTQTVSLKAPQLAEIITPKDITIEATGLTAEEVALQLTEPILFGDYPIELDQHSASCSIAYAYEDFVKNLCGNTFEIMRTWVLTNWCTGEILEQEQIITVVDTQAPTFMYETIVIGIEDMNNSIELSASTLGIEDASAPITIVATYIIGNDTIVNNSGILENITLGTYTLDITATDACMNSVTQTIILIVVPESTIEPPTINCPNEEELIFCSNATDCEALISLTLEAYNNCVADSSLLSYAYAIDLNNDGTIEEEGTSNTIEATYPNGTHSIEWKVKDSCGNTGICAYNFTITDCEAPSIVCIDIYNSEVDNDGCVYLWATDFIEEAWDNCTTSENLMNSASIRRANTNDVFEEYITICCDELGSTALEVQLVDDNMNTNSCQAILILEDISGNCLDSFSYTCPQADLSINTIDLNNLDLYGEPIIINGLLVNYSETQHDFDDCSMGSVERKWTILDPETGDLHYCEQLITVIPTSDFTVQFPNDLTIGTINCDYIPFVFDEPVIDKDDVELVAFTSEDKIVEDVEDACVYIYRTWTVVNWCIYDDTNENNTKLGTAIAKNLYEDDGDGYFEYTQVIKVIVGAATENIVETEPNDQAFFIENEAVAPLQFSVAQNYPNPFYGTTTIDFHLSKKTVASLHVYDINGRIVETIEGTYGAGNHQITLNSTKWNTTGTLYYQLSTPTEAVVKQMIVQ